MQKRKHRSVDPRKRKALHLPPLVLDESGSPNFSPTEPNKSRNASNASPYPPGLNKSNSPKLSPRVLPSVQKPRVSPLVLDEFSDPNLPPLDTTVLMKKTKYSFLKRKAIDINAKFGRPINELKTVEYKARQLLRLRYLTTNRKYSCNSSCKPAASKVVTATPSPLHNRCCGAKEYLKFDPATVKHITRNRHNAYQQMVCYTLNKRIQESNKEAERSCIKFYRNISEQPHKFREEKAKWGASEVVKKAKLNTFGRLLARNSPAEGPPKYSRESLDRLLKNDLRRYFDSEEQFVHAVALNMVSNLLLQADNGAKFRKPVSFG